MYLIFTLGHYFELVMYSCFYEVICDSESDEI